MSTNVKIKWGQPDIGEEEAEAVKEAVADGWISGFGPRIKLFEERFARKVDAKYAIAVCNGTCGLIAMLMAQKQLMNRIFGLNIAVPIWTYIATATTADLVGHASLVDVDKDTFTIRSDVSFWEDVIMAVDIGGFPANYDVLHYHNKPILSDSAQALGATYKGEKVGSIADATLFSFFSSKIITTGEGGMITTNKSHLADRIRKITNQGYVGDPSKYIHEIKGYNFRMTEMQAAIGLVQLEKLSKYLRHRREIAKIYKDIIGEGADYQKALPRTNPSYYSFTILVSPQRRNEIVHNLFKAGIQTRILKPISMQPPYMTKTLFRGGDYIYRRNIQLPIHNTLTEEEAKFVAEMVKDEVS